MTERQLPHDALEAGRVAALVPAVHRSFLTSLLSITIFSALLYQHSTRGLLVWLGLRLAVSVGSTLSLRRLRADQYSAATVRTLTIIMGISGVVWGLIPLLIRPEAPEWQAVVVLWLFGNQSVITVVCSPSRPVFVAAIGTVTVIGAGATASQGGSFNFVLAAVLLLGGVYSVSIFAALHRSVTAAIGGQLKARDLASSLQEQQVELSAANDALSKLANSDPLTRLPNRRAFEHQLVDGQGRLRAEGWLGIIDIDHFKSINDTYGHGVGDHVLSVAASRWRGMLPDDALLARLGGDEFTVYFSSRSSDEARLVGQRLLAVFNDPIAVDNKPAVEISCSIGMVSVEAGQPISAGLAGADSALYEVKGGGRRDVVVRDGSDDSAAPRFQYPLPVEQNTSTKD